jgi:hypothetical protein
MEPGMKDFVPAVAETCHPIMATGRYPAGEGWVNTFAVTSGNPEHPEKCRLGGLDGSIPQRPRKPQMQARYPRRLAA